MGEKQRETKIVKSVELSRQLSKRKSRERSDQKSELEKSCWREIHIKNEKQKREREEAEKKI